MAVTKEEIIPNVHGKPKVILSSDKFKQTFTVEPQIGGYIMYKVNTSTGKIPKELTGMFTTMKAAVKAVEVYESSAKASKAVARDKKYEERH